MISVNPEMHEFNDHCECFDEVRRLRIAMARGQRDEIAKQLELAERNYELTMRMEDKSGRE